MVKGMARLPKSERDSDEEAQRRFMATKPPKSKKKSKTKREHFVTQVTCPECALNGSATWEESQRGNLETTIKSISDGFRINAGTEIYSAECGVKATIGKTCQRRSKNASAGRSKNTSAMLARRPPNWGPFRQASSLRGIIRRSIGA